VVNPRSDVSLATGPVDEAQRMASLWSQIGRGMSVNVQVAALIENGMLPARNVTAALQMWQSVRATQVTNPAAVKDSLLTITALLADYYLVNGDVARVRAFYESALEACHEPRHQQWLRGSMCSSAARVGDFDAAGRWLSACNPQPPDLMSDTSYRVAYAYLATAQNRFDDVFAALGPATDSVPLFSARRLLAHVLRANAYEKKGDPGTATTQLRAVVAGDPMARTGLPAMAQAHHKLALCAQAMPAALR
jgi:hypothetical protein